MLFGDQHFPPYGRPSLFDHPPRLLYLKDIYLSLGKPFFSQWPDLAIENLTFEPIVLELVWTHEVEHPLFMPVSPLSCIPATTHESVGNHG